jgi:hypothetical protein
MRMAHGSNDGMQWQMAGAGAAHSAPPPKNSVERPQSAFFSITGVGYLGQQPTGHAIISYPRCFFFRAKSHYLELQYPVLPTTPTIHNKHNSFETHAGGGGQTSTKLSSVFGAPWPGSGLGAWRRLLSCRPDNQLRSPEDRRCDYDDFTKTTPFHRGVPAPELQVR